MACMKLRQLEKGFVSRFRNDVMYRRKLLQLFRVCFVFGMMGWTEALNGPTFPDLRMIINEDLDTSSWLFTATSLGYLLGSMATGFLYRLKHKDFLFAGVILCLALAVGVVPWCSYFYLMMLAKFLLGCFGGIVCTGSNAEVVSMSKENTGVYMQILHFCYSLGAMISPLLAQPFLSTDHCRLTGKGSNVSVTLSQTKASVPTAKTSVTVTETRKGLLRSATADLSNSSHVSVALHNISLQQSSTKSNTENDSVSTFLNSANTSQNVITTECDEISSETNVMYIYLITTVILVLISIAFIVASFTSKKDVDSCQHQTTENSISTTELQTLPTQTKTLVLGLVALLLLLYCGTEISFVGFLSTFAGLEFNWSEQKGAVATSVFWICFGLGRFAGIFFARVIKAVIILYIFPVLLLVSQLCFLAAALLNIEPLVLISVGMIGAARSVIFPSLFTWTTESVTPVTGRISSLFLTSSSTGVILFPILFGYTMDLFSPKWFLYLPVGVSALWIIILTVAVLLSKRLLRPLTVEMEVPEEQSFISE